MSFGLVLQKNGSPDNQLDKTLTTMMSLTGVLKEGSSIIDPVILVETSSGDIFQSNYMTIDTFGRSYFITNIESYKNDLFYVHGHVDVLSTYKAGIRSNRAIIRRQKESWNLYLNDGVLRALQPSKIQLLKFPYDMDNFNYILTVAGN